MPRQARVESAHEPVSRTRRMRLESDEAARSANDLENLFYQHQWRRSQPGRDHGRRHGDFDLQLETIADGRGRDVEDVITQCRSLHFRLRWSSQRQLDLRGLYEAVIEMPESHDQLRSHR